MKPHFKQTTYGFEYGSTKVERLFSDEKTGSVTIGITTPKHPNGIQVYATKTGKVRVFGNGEWKKPQLSCGACPGDGTVCKNKCRLAEESPTP